MRTPSTKHTYKYIFRSNSHGLAPLGPTRPDKFINPATLGNKADYIFDVDDCPPSLTLSGVNALLAIRPETKTVPNGAYYTTAIRLGNPRQLYFGCQRNTSTRATLPPFKYAGPLMEIGTKPFRLVFFLSWGCFCSSVL